VWQSLGQWWRITVHVSADAGSVPSCASVAEPEKLIVSPTFHVSVDDGVEIVGVGGVLFAVIVIGLETVEAPWLSVTCSLTV
jgi:hypothetical protein